VLLGRLVLDGPRIERRSRPRPGTVELGVGLTALGANYSVMALTMGNDDSDKFAAMSMAGPASVFWSIGLAVFAPALLQRAASVGARLVGGSAAGHVATVAMRRRSFELSGALMPVIVLVGISTGTLYMVGIDAANGELRAHDVATNSTELLNLVVVGMVCVFAAMMVVTTLVATVAARRREFGLQRLAGSTRGQVTTMAGIEAALLAATGIAVGGAASLGAVVPCTESTRPCSPTGDWPAPSKRWPSTSPCRCGSRRRFRNACPPRSSRPPTSRPWSAWPTWPNTPARPAPGWISPTATAG
jgi:hypothetical protein